MSKLKIFFLMASVLGGFTLAMFTMSTADKTSKLEEQGKNLGQKRVICKYKLNKMNSSLRPGEKKRTPRRCFENKMPLVDELQEVHMGELMTKQQDGLYISGERIY